MIEVRQTAEFSHWLRSLRDAEAFARIVQRIRRMERGDAGDARPVGGGVMEMRIDHGPGDRVYYARRGFAAVILLCGGDKRRQQQDIERAHALASNMEEW